MRCCFGTIFSSVKSMVTNLLEFSGRVRFWATYSRRSCTIGDPSVSFSKWVELANHLLVGLYRLLKISQIRVFTVNIIVSDCSSPKLTPSETTSPMLATEPLRTEGRHRGGQIEKMRQGRLKAESYCSGLKSPNPSPIRWSFWESHQFPCKSTGRRKVGF